MLYDGKLIIEVLHGNNTDDPSYIIALDPRRASECGGSSARPTPVANRPTPTQRRPVLTHDGQPQIVVSGGDYVTGHDPANGRNVAGRRPEPRRERRITASSLRRSSSAG